MWKVVGENTQNKKQQDKIKIKILLRMNTQ